VAVKPRRGNSRSKRAEEAEELKETRRQLEETNVWAEKLAAELAATSAELVACSQEAAVLRDESMAKASMLTALEAEVLELKSRSADSAAEVDHLREKLDEQMREAEEITSELIAAKLANAQIHEECAKLRSAARPARSASSFDSPAPPTPAAPARLFG